MWPHRSTRLHSVVRCVLPQTGRPGSSKGRRRGHGSLPELWSGPQRVQNGTRGGDACVAGGAAPGACARCTLRPEEKHRVRGEARTGCRLSLTMTLLFSLSLGCLLALPHSLLHLPPHLVKFHLLAVQILCHRVLVGLVTCHVGVGVVDVVGGKADVPVPVLLPLA